MLMKPARSTLLFVVSLLAPVAAFGAEGPPMPVTTADFCSAVQHEIAGTKVAVVTKLHKQFEDFVKSKASLQPLETEQYVQYEDAAGAQPMRISCKTKAPDAINARYGAGSATADLSCRDINRRIIRDVWAAMPPSQRAAASLPPWRIMLDGDDMTVRGSKYVAPYPFVYVGDDGQTHVLSISLRVNWDDWLWKWAPDRVRGVHYCHLLAPEYALRLMRGDVRAAAPTAR